MGGAVGEFLAVLFDDGEVVGPLAVGGSEGGGAVWDLTMHHHADGFPVADSVWPVADAGEEWALAHDGAGGFDGGEDVVWGCAVAGGCFDGGGEVGHAVPDVVLWPGAVAGGEDDELGDGVVECFEVHEAVFSWCDNWAYLVGSHGGLPTSTYLGEGLVMVRMIIRPMPSTKPMSSMSVFQRLGVDDAEEAVLVAAADECVVERDDDFLAAVGEGGEDGLARCDVWRLG